ncbi:MAG TPA: flagellar biosynthetic protein FliR [Candidatus Sulfotelmatobacter sp.]|jgi:flagellar biosynthetic protein FliR|nr:flagellar biosynthetic protein FliR [Candidatus Sulfotelmatobacter sp.]
MLAALQRILADLGIHEDVTVLSIVFGLIFTRLVTAIALAPFLGGRAVSSRIKVGLAAIISAILYSPLAPKVSPGDLDVVRVLGLLVKEAVIGSTIGILSQIIFHSIQMAGATMDYGRGMSQATFFAPQLETNVSLIGQLQLQASIVMFLVLNGHLLFLRALAASFQTIPVLQFPQFRGGAMLVMEQLARYTGESLLIAVQLSAPVLLALFLVDISFGMLGKVAQGLNVHNESQPVKAMFGLAVFLLSLSYTISRMPGYFSEMVQQIELLVRNIV